MVQDSSDPALTIGFIKKECFKFNLRYRDGVCLPNPEWELVPQERSLLAEGSTSHSTLIDSWNHKRACTWVRSDLWGQYSAMSSVIHEGAWLWRASYVRSRILNYILNFTRSQCREAKTGVIWSLLLVPVSTRAAAFLDKLEAFHRQ